MKTKDLEKVWDFLETIKPGQVHYIKSLAKGNMFDGEFSSKEEFINELKEMPDISLYTIPNKIRSDRFAESERNRLFPTQQDGGIKKEDIVSRNYIFVDFDVVHEGVKELSATDEEHMKAKDLMTQVATYLEKEFNFPEPIVCDSGNGYYLLYKTEELENNTENDAVFRDIIRALANKFNTDNVIIDAKVHNANRLIKAIGSKAVKGEETKDRKHRFSKLVSVPEVIKPIAKETLYKVVTWGTKLKSKPVKQSSGFSAIDEDKSNADMIAEAIERNAKFFLDQNQEPWATCNLPTGEIRSYPIESGEFKRWAQRIICNELQMKAVKKDYYNQALQYWVMLAYESGNIIKVQNRIAVNDMMTEIYYDCNTCDNKAVKIANRVVEIINAPKEMFRREKSDAQQVLPNTNISCSELIPYIEKYFNCASQEDIILLSIYIVTCFLGTDINHPIMIFSGSKGSAKSTATRYIQQLVSPQITGITMMSKKVEDVAVRLSHSLLAVFDNLSQISEGISDLLCVGVTGGTYPKRKLFTDNEEIYLQLKAMIIMNGVNVVAEKSDLLDRSLVIELKRLTYENMISPTTLNNMFQDDLPDILGAIMNAVAISIADEESIEPDHLIRMADFHIWGIKVARALGIPKEDFEDALLKNQSRINENALDNYPVASLLMDLVAEKAEWVGAMSKLYSELTSLAVLKNINTHQSKFPKDAGALSRRLKEVESNLAEFGIRYSVRNIGSCKEIVVTNSNASERKIAPKHAIISSKTKAELLGEDDDNVNLD